MKRKLTTKNSLKKNLGGGYGWRIEGALSRGYDDDEGMGIGADGDEGGREGRNRKGKRKKLCM